MPLRQSTPAYGDQGVMTSVPRWAVTNALISSTSGTIRLGYFRANRSATFSSIRAGTGSTAAAATPTTCLMGLYSVASNGDLTRVAITANDTTLFAATATGYTRALTSPVAVVQGSLYAAAEIVVSGVATPTLAGAGSVLPLETELDERTSGFVSGQTTLPGSISAASVTSSSFQPYFALIP